jgi:radical SAM superfamily enzyme YgiQ (UPF0313 family)
VTETSDRGFRHVLCLYPYREDLKHGRYYPPLGLEIIAGLLAPHSAAIEVVDLRHEAGVAADFVRPETDLVCFSVNWERDLDFVRAQIRAIPAGRRVVVGGRHATEAPEQWLADCPNIDVLVRGDGEEAVEELIAGRPLEDIAGISFRRDGRIVHTPNRQVGPVRDEFRPDRRLRRYRYELDFEGARSGIGFDTISGSRGCPFHCKFCSFNLNPWGQKRAYSARSPESVVEELAGMDAQVVIFTDDVFTHDVARVEAICELIVRRGIRKHFIVNSRLEIARRMDVVRKMERAGFSGLLLGVESAQDKTLRAMSKGFDTARIAEHFASLRHTRMILHGYFIIGCVGETVPEMLAIAPFARRLGLDTLGLSPLRSVPHDGIRKLVADTPGYHLSPEGFVYSDEVSEKRLRAVRRLIWRKFYTPWHVARLAWKALSGGAVTPGMLARVTLAAVRGEFARRRRRRERERRRLQAVRS